nr:hypothetical protein [Tanacetum cinerariifolium]
LAQVEERLAELRNRELKYCEKIRGLEFKTESSADCIESLPEFADDTITDYSRPSPTIEIDCTEVKTNKVEDARKSSIRYAELYRKTPKGFNVKKGRACPKNNCTHKSMPPRAVVHKTVRPPMRTTRPNMNAAQPKRTSIYKPAHSYLSRPVQRKSTVRTQSQVSRVSTICCCCSRQVNTARPKGSD